MAKPRNISIKDVKIPDNPIFYEFERTDAADDSAWPHHATKRVVDREGKVNWMDHVSIDHPTAIKWRITVGEHIALSKDKSADEVARTVLKDWPDNYRMYDHNKGPEHGNIRHDIYLYGPKGRRFRSIMEFVPHAVWLSRDTSLAPVLCGCKYCTGRTQTEITSKINYQSPSVGSSSQVKKADVYAGLQQKSSRREGKPKQRKPKEQAQKVFASVQKVLRPAVKLPNNILKQTLLADRHEDLRAVYSSSANKKEGQGPPGPHYRLQEYSGLRRWYRTAESVWVKLPERGVPIANPTSEGDAPIAAWIEYWPGIVETWTLKSRPVEKPSPAPHGNGNRSPPTTGTDVDSISASKGFPSQTEPTTSLWDVQQSYTYRIRLLGVDVQLEVGDDQVLPYAAYFPPLIVMTTIGHLPMEQMDFDRETVAKFNPIAMARHSGNAKGKGKAPMPVDGDEDEPQDIFQAASAFAMAAQIAESLTTYWAVTDRYEFLYRPWGTDPQAPKLKPTPSPLAPSSSTLSSSQNGSLSAAIEAAGRANFAPVPSTTGTGVDYYTHHDLSRPNGNGSLDEAGQAAKSMLGVPFGHFNVPMRPPTQSASTVEAMSDSLTTAYNSASASAPVVPRPPPLTSASGGSNKSNSSSGNEVTSQSRYQGVWWGAERIWEDDFVRLNMSRGALAPEGGPNVLRPSGPGKDSRSMWEEAERLRQRQEQLLRLQELSEPGTGSAERDEAAAILDALPKDINEYGAASRGTFMRINSFFSVDVIKDGRVIKQMRVSGMLYELADHDFEESDDPNAKAKAKAKAKANGNGNDTPLRFEATVNPAMLPPPTPTKEGSSEATMASPSMKRTVAQSSPPRHYLDPQPPSGYKFRPILAPGYEAIISLNLTAGRYYPRICSHPLIAPRLQAALESGHREQYKDIWALEGLWPGHYNATHPGEHKKYRTAMVEEADRLASEQLEMYKRDTILQALGGNYSASRSPQQDDGDVPMDEDEAHTSVRENELLPHAVDHTMGMDVD